MIKLSYIDQGEIVGINSNLEVFTGYDNCEREANARNVKPEWCDEFEFISREEKITIADKMIALWQKYKDEAE